MDKINTNYGLKTQLREMIFPAYFAGQIDRSSAIARLKVSDRQFCRLQSRYLSKESLQHQLCGKPSNHSIDIAIKDQVIELYKTKYRGWNYQHIHSFLLQYDNIDISPDTIRNTLLTAKLTLPKQRKARKYMRREPKSKFNQMLQLDGTFADFLGDGRMLCLMHLVDDATKTSLAMLFDAECTDSALQILYQWCLKYGIPESIYSDRHSTYKVNERQRLTIEEELEGVDIRLSEFGKVCGRLGIKQIFAHSPQAKGRVERRHQLFKDRYIKELRLHGIKTIDKANEYLVCEDGFNDRINKQFTIEPKEARTACVLPTPADLAEQFTIHNTRTVRNDYTIQFNTIVYQLLKTPFVNARAKVLIKKYLNGSMAIFAGKHKLQYKIVEDYIKSTISRDKSSYKCPVVHKPISRTEHPFRQHYRPEKVHRYASSSTQLQFIGQVYGG